MLFSKSLAIRKFSNNRKQEDALHWSAGSDQVDRQQKPSCNSFQATGRQAGREIPFTGQQAVIRQTGSRTPAVIPVRQQAGMQGDTLHWSAGSDQADRQKKASCYSCKTTGRQAGRYPSLVSRQ